MTTVAVNQYANNRQTISKQYENSIMHTLEAIDAALIGTFRIAELSLRINEMDHNSDITTSLAVTIALNANQSVLKASWN